MRSRTIALSLVVVLALAAGTVVAQRGRGRGMGGGMGMGMMNGGQCGLGLGLGMGMGAAAMKELGLTNEQTASLQALTNKFVSETQPTRTQLQTRLKELGQLWTADKPDKAAIRSKIGEIDRLRAQIRDAMVERTFAAMRVLTPEQKTKLRGFVKNRPGFGMGLGCGLGMGSNMAGSGCYMMGGTGGAKR